jgi:hypothetical protein
MPPGTAANGAVATLAGGEHDRQGLLACSTARCSLPLSPPGSGRAHGRPARCRLRPVLWRCRSPFAGARGVLVGADDGGIHADVPGDHALGIGLRLQGGEDLLPGAVALPAANQPIDGLPGPVTGRHVPPRRPGAGPPTDPVDQLAFAPLRRPAGLDARGSNASSLARCWLVRSPRPMRGTSHRTRPLLKHALEPYHCESCQVPLDAPQRVGAALVSH